MINVVIGNHFFLSFLVLYTKERVKISTVILSVANGKFVGIFSFVMEA